MSAFLENVLPKSAFPIDAGMGGAGAGAYAAGLLVLADGTTRGVETVARLTPRAETEKAPSSQRLPGFLDTLRGVLPASARLPMPARLAVSTVRAGLGVIEEGFAPGAVEPVPVEIAFLDGATLVARLPPELVAAIRRDREVALGALARSAGPVPETVPVAEGTTEALTSIFRYEKRNGRLRRVAEPDPSAEG